MRARTANVVSWVRRRMMDRKISERGAVIFLVAGSAVVLIVAGSLAVDIAAQQNRAQSLQNAVDSAALAGVEVWARTEDQAEATSIVYELLAQNGLTDADQVVDITFPDATKLGVTITDPSNQALVAVGSLNDLRRSAEAEHVACEAPCGSTIEIPPPFLSIDALGSGDGFRPTVVGTKLYGVNHHEETMACVDRVTQQACFFDGALFPSGLGYETDWTVSEGVVGTKVFYLGQNDTYLTLFCWETVTDSRCGPRYELAELAGRPFRGGALAVVSDKVYVVTDDHRMHCIDPALNGNCAGFGNAGIATGLDALIAPLEEGDAVGNYDQVVDLATKRIYYTLKSEEPATYLDCWDVAMQSPCWNFSAVEVTPRAEKKGGRLFLYHEPRLDPLDVPVASGVCVTDDGQITCYNMFGGLDTGKSGVMSSLEADLEDFGVHLQHPPTNRLVLQAGDNNLCWDFDAQVRCGDNDAGSRKDYGFSYEGNCIFALGHNSIFWSFALDFTEGCPGTSTVQRIDPCTCSGGEQWPQVTFESPAASFTSIDVTIRDPDGNALTGVIDLLNTPNATIDLSGFSNSYEYLSVAMVIELDPNMPDPWTDFPTKPTLVVQIPSRPRLTR